MKKNKHSHFIITKARKMTITRIQEGITVFTERPSDEHELQTDEKKDSVSNPRINAVDLFSLFTADIIKKEVIFTR